ncbi:hypothetical protein [Halobacillus andaensis]
MKEKIVSVQLSKKSLPEDQEKYFRMAVLALERDVYLSLKSCEGGI